ncbi:hypothetical protein BAUCODRAFT_75853 [Baudoinia panamericana UAMH 10762]|uniref:Major facilitator superfamily (MFS) profile domain-containing protein n=1 Tax=Baudoinia panamericana (strain UAMH 10762) TaxID=717646 RepID=M2N4L6_BAUPA|nr:uncharacterized protein BAUCODRAFT_75853 [Baudoinia panamericana UAMH 10762]EMC93670.1 hypothetical protein BAUCODRAFT_75853 [Baudoinia panamericana UAMH 10762]
MVVEPPSEPTTKLSTVEFILLVISLCFAIFCQALDNTIIATAIPRITDEFNSLDDVGWYASGYLLTTCAFQLSYGKLYNLFPIQWVFLVCLGIFELGSLVCGATPNSVGLIMGRVVAGIGSGGVFVGAILIIANTVPLAKRPIFNGVFGAMFAIASVAGPLLGGAFTDHVTWRLCFYINLPFGLISAICVLFFLRKMPKPPKASLPLKEKMKEFDLIGLLIFIPTIVCLLLALQWGGSTYSWSNGRIIALFVVAGLLLTVFIGVQIWQKDRATVPFSVIKQRTVWASALYSLCLFGSFISLIYYIPIWFQAIKGDTATESGIHNLPVVLGVVVMSMLSGGAIFAVGYYTWAPLLSSVVASIGGGLLTTLGPNTDSAHWIGYQALYGVGLGIGLQVPIIAIQTALPEEQISEGTAIVMFIQTFGGSVFISVAQNIFNNKLIANVAAAGVPVNPAALLGTGATQLAALVPPSFLPQLRVAYNKAITETFYVAVATAALSIVGSALIPWFSVKNKPGEKKDTKKAEQKTEENDV